MATIIAKIQKMEMDTIANSEIVSAENTNSAVNMTEVSQATEQPIEAESESVSEQTIDVESVNEVKDISNDLGELISSSEEETFMFFDTINDETDTAPVVEEMSLPTPPSIINPTVSNSIDEYECLSISQVVKELQKQDAGTCSENLRLLMNRMMDPTLEGDSIATIINLIKSNLQVESHLITASFSEAALTSFLSDYESKNRRVNVETVKKWLKDARPLDMTLLIELIRETEESSRLIERQEVAILLGPTGAGKSTTIHYLCGSTFTLITDHYDEILEIKPSTHVDVSQFLTSSHMKSTTRFIRPIRLDQEKLEILGCSNSQIPLVLCDSPGFGDTNGPEMDISNGRGITRALQNTTAVRIVVIISDQLGNRGEYLAKIAEDLVSMLTEVESNLHAITYCFTKWSKPRTILGKLLKIQEANDQGPTHPFSLLLNHLIESVKEKLYHICPEDDGVMRGCLLDMILNSKPITDPHRVFKDFVCESSLDALKSQLTLHEKSICAHLRSEDYEIVRKLLRELQIVNSKISTEIGKQCSTFCAQAVDVLVRQKVKMFESCYSRIENKKYPLISDADQDELFALLNTLVKLRTLLPLESDDDSLLEPVIIDACFTKVERLAKLLTESFEVIFQQDDQQDDYRMTLSMREKLDVAISCIEKVHTLYCVLKSVVELPIETIAFVENRYQTMKTVLNEYLGLMIIFIDHKFLDRNVVSWRFALDAAAALKTIISLCKLHISHPICSYVINVCDSLKNEFSQQVALSNPVCLYSICSNSLDEAFQRPSREIEDAKSTFWFYETIANLDSLEDMYHGAQDDIRNILLTRESFISTICEMTKTVIVSAEPFPFVDFNRLQKLLQLLLGISDKVDPTILSSVRQMITVSITEVKDEIRKLEKVKVEDLDPSAFWRGFVNSINSALLDSLNIDVVDQDTGAVVALDIIEKTVSSLGSMIENCLLTASLTSLTEFSRLSKLITQIDRLTKEFPSVTDPTGALKQLCDLLDRFGVLRCKLSEMARQQLVPEQFISSSISYEPELLCEAFFLAEQIPHLKENIIEPFVKTAGDCINSKTTDCWDMLRKIGLDSSFSPDVKLVENWVHDVVDISSKMEKLQHVYSRTEAKFNDIAPMYGILFDKMPKSVFVTINAERKTLCEELRTQIGVIQDKDIQRLRYLLSISLVLIKLDGIRSETLAFTALNADICTIIHSKTDSLRDDTRLRIQQEDFVMVHKKLDELKEISESDYAMCCDLLQQTIRQMADNVQLSINRITTRCTVAEVMQTKNSLTLLHQSHSQIATHIDAAVARYRELMSNFRDNILKRVSAPITKELSQSQFDLIELEIIFTRDLRDALVGFDFLEDVQSRFIALTKQLDAAVNDACSAILDAEIHSYPKLSPKAFVDKLIQCSELERVENRGDIYKSICDQLNEELIRIMRWTLIRSAGNGEEEISLQIYEENVSMVIQAGPFLPMPVWGAIETLCSEASLVVNKEREKLAIYEDEKVLANTIHEHIDRFYELANHQEHKSASKLKHKLVEVIRSDIFSFVKKCLGEAKFDLAIVTASIVGEDILYFVNKLNLLKEKLRNRTITINAIAVKSWISKTVKYEVLIDGRKRTIPSTPDIVRTGKYTYKPAPDERLEMLYSSEELSRGLTEMYNDVSESLNISLSIVQTMNNSQLGDKRVHINNILLAIWESAKKEFQCHVLKPLSDRIQSMLDKIDSLFFNFHEETRIAFETGDVAILKKSLDISKICSSVFDLWTRIIATKPGEFPYPEARSSILSYPALQITLADYLKKWCNDVTGLQYIDNAATQTRSGLDRDKFYAEVSSSLTIVMNFDMIAEHSLVPLGDLQSFKTQCIRHISDEIKKIVDRLSELHDQIPFQSEDLFVRCNYTYDNLRSIRDTFDETSVKEESRSNMEIVTNKFLAKFRLIQAEILSFRDLQMTRTDAESIIAKLLILQAIANKIPSFFSVLDALIDAILGGLKKGYGAMKQFSLICQILTQKVDSRTNASNAQNTQNDLVSALLRHSAFDEINTILRNKKVKTFTIFHVLGLQQPTVGKPLENVAGGIISDDLNVAAKGVLYANFVRMDDMYWDLVNRGLGKKTAMMAEIVANVRGFVCDNRNEYIIKLMAHLFAYWTLHRYTGDGIKHEPRSDVTTAATTIASTDSESTTADDPKDSLVQPHAAQIIAIFRLLGVEDITSPTLTAMVPLEKHFVQISTGEGKSVAIAVTSSVLALLGFSVDCACYSKYLSDRDYDEFKFMFTAFDLLPFIKYGTFGDMCENFINSTGNIRSQVESMICGRKSIDRPPIDTRADRVPREPRNARPTILMIDEVDTFFNKDYYGKLYKPISQIRHPTIATLAKLLWSNRRAPLSWTQVKTSQEYLSCVAAFGKWGSLLEEIIKGMVCDLSIVTSAQYTQDYQIVEGERIAYKEEDGFNSKIVRGYETMFTYMKEHELNRTISLQSMEKELVGRLISGGFSYAEVPKHYTSILGVTGTLKQLVDGPEGNIMKREYGINRYTYMPSVYGANKCEFAGDTSRDVAIVENAEYFIRINEEIESRMRATDGSQNHRAVFVFFENMSILEEFKKDSVFIAHSKHADVLIEKTNLVEKKGIIRAAASSGNITLMTRAFGRGTDFMCNDECLVNAGGVHVIQTFFSEQIAEEVQIRGRTARQGDKGSYGLVLRQSDLDKFGLSAADVKAIIDSGIFYSKLNAARNKYYSETLFPIISRGIEGIVGEFNESMVFKQALGAGDEARVQEFLIKYNKQEMSASGAGRSSRTIVLMDATGSMEPLLNIAKSRIKSMFTNLTTLMTTATSPANQVTIQFAVYRNYNAPANMILECSEWEPLSSNPARLDQFMDRLKPDFGLGAEAIEIGFAHVLSEHAIEPVAQVILIGDRECNSMSDVEDHRRDYAENLNHSLLTRPTCCDDLIPLLQQEEIPVHSFYLTSYAQSCFTGFSARTGGVSKPLDVSASDAAQILTDTVSVRIAHAAGGDQLVSEYIRRFAVGYSE